MQMKGSSRADAPPQAKRLEDLPHPAHLPLIGNLHLLDPEHFHEQLEGWNRQFGPYFTVSIGRRRIFVTSDLETGLTAMRDRPGRFRRLSTIEPVAKEMGINGAFSVEGERWRPQRDLVTRALAPGQLESFFPTLCEITERLRRRWARAAQERRDSDILQDLTRYTVDTTATLVFGTDVNTLESSDDSIQKHLAVVLPMVSWRVNALFPYWRYFKLPKDYQLDRSLREVRAFAERMIDLARQRMRAAPGAKPRNFLEAMLQLRDEPHSGFSDDDVYANIITLLLAGEDTTAFTLAWTMHILSTRPDLQQRLQAAAREALPDTLLPTTFADTSKLGLFEGAAFEAMRMKAVTPMSYLEANEDTVLGGYAIPKGTPVFVLTRPPALEDSHFRAAADFAPERWGGKRESHREGHNTRAFLAFGAGPRFCPGRYLATLEMKMVLAMLSRNFAFTPAEDPSLTKELFAFTVMPNRLKLRLTTLADA